MKKILALIFVILFTNYAFSQSDKDIDGEVKIKEEYDEFEKMTSYEPEYFPSNKKPYAPTIYCLAFSDGDDVAISLGINYITKEMIFIDKIILLYDKKTKEIEIDFNNYDSEILDSGYIFESASVNIYNDDDFIDYLYNFSQSTNSRMRVKGRGGYKDYTINTIDKKAIKTIIDKYKELAK